MKSVRNIALNKGAEDGTDEWRDLGIVGGKETWWNSILRKGERSRRLRLLLIRHIIGDVGYRRFAETKWPTGDLINQLMT